MEVASMYLGVWSWSRQSPELQTECQNGKERWFKQFLSVAWLLVLDRPVWGFHNLLSYWDFHVQQFARFTKNGVKRERTSSMRQSCGRKCLVDARGQRRIGRLIQNVEVDAWAITGDNPTGYLH